MEEEAQFVKARSLRMIDPEAGYDDPIAGARAEEIALSIDTSINPRALPTRNYINDNLSELIIKGLHEVHQCRPENPAEFLAYYLLKHNPYSYMDNIYIKLPFLNAELISNYL